VIALFKLTHYPPQIHRERERETKKAPGVPGLSRRTNANI